MLGLNFYPEDGRAKFVTRQVMYYNVTLRRVSATTVAVEK